MITRRRSLRLSKPTAKSEFPGSPSRRGRTPRRRPGGSHRAVLIAGVATFLTGLVYPTIVAEAFTGWTLPISNSYLSEYSARSMPFSMWFRILDATAGSLAVVAAVAFLAVARNARWSRLHRLYGWLLLAFGAGTICDAILPLDCAVVQDWCAEMEFQGRLSIEHDIHVVTSSIATGSAMACAIAVVVLWWWRPRGPRPSVVAMVIASASVAANVWFLVAYVVLDQVAGVAQRANVTLFALLLMVVGFSVARNRRAIYSGSSETLRLTVH